MKETYKRENHKSYLVLKKEDMGQEAGFALKMLCDNSIPGLLPLSEHIFNGEEELYYDISSRQPLSIQFEKKEMQKQNLEILFSDMKSVLEKLDEYLMDMEYLVLNPEHIYIRSADEHIDFLYTFCKDEDFEHTTYAFAEYLLDKIQNEDEQAVVYAYGFYRYIKEEKGDLVRALERLSQDKIAEIEQPEEIEQLEELEKPEFYLDEETSIEELSSSPFQEEKKQSYKVMRTSFLAVLGLGGIGMIAYSAWKYSLLWGNLFSKSESIIGAGIVAMSIGGIALFALMDYLAKKDTKEDVMVCERTVEPYLPYEEGETDEREDVFSPMAEVIQPVDCATVLLQENCYEEQRILIGRIRGKKKQIDLSSFPFVVGKNREQADYVIEDSSVSRIHARFTLRDDVVYLTDLNSTNGTRRNGIPLNPNELVMLEADDEITFGRVTFTYH